MRSADTYEAEALDCLEKSKDVTRPYWERDRLVQKAQVLATLALAAATENLQRGGASRRQMP